MPISLSCSCGRAIRARDDLAGLRVKCPQCGAPLTVPSPERSEEGLIPLVDPWAKATRRADETPKKPAEDEVIGEVLPADDEDEVQLEVVDDDERSMREQVRREEERDQEREAERGRKRRKKRMRERYNRALEEEAERRYERPGRGASGGDWFGSVNAGVGGGIAMLVIGLLCTGIGLKFGWLFFIGPILVIIGFIAIVKGIFDNNV
jgi:hypothetical protein